MPSTFQRHPNPGVVTVGVDTHADVHVAAAVDGLGRLLASTAIPTTVEGYAELLAWAEGFGQVGCFGIEGTGSWGAGLTRWLAANGQAVVEVPRPDRARRRRKGKSDTLDAEAAARAALVGLDVGIPKRQDGPVEVIRALRVARRSAMKARIQAGNQLLGLLTRAPEELRARLWKLRGRSLVEAALRLEPAAGVPVSVTSATEVALWELAGRWHGLDGEIARLDEPLDALVRKIPPDLLALPGVGTETAAALLEAAGDNPKPAHQRSCVRAPVRRRAATGVLGQDHPAPLQPRRPPRRQRGTVAHRAGQDEVACADPRLRRPAHRRGPVQARDHAVLEALRGPRGLPLPQAHRQVLLVGRVCNVTPATAARSLRWSP
jgi:transposase